MMMTRDEFESERDEILEAQDRMFHGIPFPAGKGLQEIVLWYGTTWPDLAGFIGIDESVTMRVGHGMMLDPIGPRFVDALAFALETDAAIIREAITFDRVHHGSGSDVSPTKPEHEKTYREAVAASAMSQDLRRFWLEDAPFPRWERPQRSAPAPGRVPDRS